MKQIAGILLCLALLLACAAGAESYIARWNGAEEGGSEPMLIDSDGRVLVPRGAYDVMYRVTPQDYPADRTLYAAFITDVPAGLPEEALYDTDAFVRCALLDARGEPLTDFAYHSLEWDAASQSIVFLDPDLRYGAMDARGNILLEAGYFGLAPNGLGGYLAMGCDGDAEADYGRAYPIYYINPAGSVFFTGLSCSPGNLCAFSDGLCLVYGAEGDAGGGCLFLNAEGAPAFEGRYLYAESFHGGCAAVQCNGGQYDLIDRQGRSVGPESYGSLDYAEAPGDEVYIAIADGRFLILDAATGEKRVETDYGDAPDLWAQAMGGGLIEVQTGSRNDLYDFSGRLLFSYPPEYGTLSADYSRVDAAPRRVTAQTGEWPDTQACLVDLEGRRHGEIFRQLSPLMWRDGHGRYLTISYDVYTDDDGWDAIDWRTMRYGVCDEEGVQVIPPRYSELQALDFDRYWVRQGIRSGMIDGAGNWLYAVSDYEYLMD